LLRKNNVSQRFGSLGLECTLFVRLGIESLKHARYDSHVRLDEGVLHPVRFPSTVEELEKSSRR
jgi:hypothetical protein